MDLSPAVALTQQLIRVDTVNPPGNETLAAELVAKPLQDAGWKVKLVPLSPGRANLIADLDGEDTRAPPLCFTGHLDVVPLGAAKWTKDPFGGEIENGRMYGRGASDMKSGVAAIAIAAARLARLTRRRTGVRLVFTAGEETGCDGVRAMLQRSELNGPLGALVVAEPTDLYPVVAHKGALWLRVTTHGKAAHGSMPELGHNAILEMMGVLAELPSLPLGAPHAVQGAPTQNVGVIRGGIIPNQVPDRCEALVDIRTVAGGDHAALLARVRSMLGARGTVEAMVDTASVATDPAHPFVQAVFAEARRFLDEAPRATSVNYFTDAALLKPALGDPPTIVCGPGERGQAHQTDEYVAVSRIEQAVELYEAIARRWLA